MDHLPTEILIRIFDKSRLSDQLISHRLINTKFRELIPTKASRSRRVDTTDLMTVSKKLAFFGQRDSAYYNTQKYLHEDPVIERAYANLLLYVCNLIGASLKSISFTAPLFLDSATMEKLAIMCPHVIEINIGYEDSRVRYLGGDVQLLFNYVYMALPRFPELKILRILSRCKDASLVRPIVARLRLQKLHSAGREAPIFTADPHLLEELVVHTWLKSGQYRGIQNRICEVFPNLRRHYMGKRHWSAFEPVQPGTAEANYRRLHMLRDSSWIGGTESNLWFIDERLFLDFPYLQNMNIEICDDGSCDRFIRALQSSRNWKAFNMVLNSGVTNEKCMQLLQALFYTTAVRLKSLQLEADLALDHGFQEQFLHFDQAGGVVVFDKTLRQCEMRGSGMLLFIAKIANACSRLNSLMVTDLAKYMQSELGLQKLLREALRRFEQANLCSLLQLALDVAHSTAYDLIQHIRGSKLDTIQLDFKRTDRKISDAHCSSLLREDMFPYLRTLYFVTDNKGIVSDIMVNMLRNLPGLQRLELVLSSKPNDDDMAPTVQLDQAVWHHIADHANLWFCSVKSHYNICSTATFASLCNVIIARKKADKNGRVLPWLYMEFIRWYGLREPNDTRHHMGENAYCLYRF